MGKVSKGWHYDKSVTSAPWADVLMVLEFPPVMNAEQAETRHKGHVGTGLGRPMKLGTPHRREDTRRADGVRARCPSIRAAATELRDGQVQRNRASVPTV